MLPPGLIFGILRCSSPAALAILIFGADLHLFQTRFVTGWENNRDGDITMPLSLKTIVVHVIGTKEVWMGAGQSDV